LQPKAFLEKSLGKKLPLKENIAKKNKNRKKIKK